MSTGEENIKSYKDFWESVGDTYEHAISMMDGSPDDRVLNLTGRYISKKIGHALSVSREDKVFELGCGVGRIGTFIAPLCLEWYGFDISGRMIQYAKGRMKEFQNVQFQTLERSAFQGIPENGFDKGYSHAVFLHLDKEDFFLYLREAYRILKPGGLFYFDTWNLANEVGWERWLWEVEAWAQSDQKERKHVGRNQFCVPQEIKIYIEKAGFLEIGCLNGSFWIQSLALKPGQGVTEEEVALMKEGVHRKIKKIGIPATLNVLFKHHLDLLKKKIEPVEFFKLLQEMEEDEEVLLYRDWLREVWKHRRDEWGDYPGKPS